MDEEDKEMQIMELEVALQSQELIMKKNILNIAKMKKDMVKYQETNKDIEIELVKKRKEIDDLTNGKEVSE